MTFRALAGGGAACAYCGFCLVVEGPRQCCAAGRDYDALAAELAEAKVDADTYRQERDDVVGNYQRLAAAARKMTCWKCEGQPIVRNSLPCPDCADLRALLAASTVTNSGDGGNES